MPYFYCATNDILVKAKDKAAAETYAKYRLSPAYGFSKDSVYLKDLNLKPISAARGEDMEDTAIFWEAT